MPDALPVLREVPRDEPLRGAILQLLAGPTADEKAAGFESDFSAETAGMLNYVSLDADGHLTVDFEDFAHLMQKAGTTAGSRMLLHEIGKTVAQFPEVERIEYLFDGSCEAFWHWLQAGCQLQSADKYRP